MFLLISTCHLRWVFVVQGTYEGNMKEYEGNMEKYEGITKKYERIMKKYVLLYIRLWIWKNSDLRVGALRGRGKNS